MEASTSSRNKQKTAKLPDQINVSQIKTSTIMYNNKKKYSLLSYENGSQRDSIFIQTPLFDSVLDLESYSEYGEYYFQIPNDEIGTKFLNFINELEQKLILLAYENKSNWFQDKENVKFRSSIKNLQSDSIEAGSQKVIKFRIPYNIKAKRLFIDSMENMGTTDTENISIKNLDGGHIRIIININAIWFSDEMFGLYIRPVYLEEIKLCEYQFQEDNNVLFLDSEMFPKESTIINHKIDDVNILNNIVKSSANAIADEKNNNLPVRGIEMDKLEEPSKSPKFNTVKLNDDVTPTNGTSKSNNKLINDVLSSELSPSRVKKNETKSSSTSMGRRLRNKNNTDSVSSTTSEQKQKQIKIQSQNNVPSKPLVSVQSHTYYERDMNDQSDDSKSEISIDLEDEDDY